MELGFAEYALSILTAGGGAALVAFQLFRNFGSTWMESQFQTKIESFRHENAKELQSLRAKIDKSLDATIRAQEREFQSLSEAWRLANIAFGSVANYVSALQSYSDVNRMSDAMRKEFIGELEILESQKEEILSASDSSEKYREIIDLQKMITAGSAVQELGNYLYLNEIFFESEFAEEFKDISDKLRAAITNKKLERESREIRSSRITQDSLNDDIRPALEKIAPRLREKFFDRI